MLYDFAIWSPEDKLHALLFVATHDEIVRVVAGIANTAIGRYKSTRNSQITQAIDF